MKTLIELYDERTIENVIGPEIFQPEKIVYLCPPDVAEDRTVRRNLSAFLKSRGLRAEVSFTEADMLKTAEVLSALRSVSASHPECALDVTGGTDASLVAAGMFCGETGIPTFTYSRRKNCFYDISNAPFAEQLRCGLEYSVEEFFRMAGGTMRKGRVDSASLLAVLPQIEAFFHVFLRFRKDWNEQITFFQRISRAPHDAEAPLAVSGSMVQKGEHGSRIRVSEALLRSLEQIGFLEDCRFDAENDRVSFRFADQQVRTWLRDVGSVLELYMFKSCLDAGIFRDVVCSAIVDWDGTNTRGSVSNEIDVVASRGVVPLFVSCKACEVKTEALNELAILSDRFGGKAAKAVIATTEPCTASARHRAAQLGIAVIDLEELSAGKASERLKVILKVRDQL